MIADNPAPMTSSELGELRERIEAHLSKATTGAVSIASIEKLAGGACQDNYVLVATFAAGAFEGVRKLVLRSDANTSLPGSLSRQKEYAVIRAAAAAGVRTPEARWLASDLLRPGTYAYFLDWVGGEAIGRRVVAASKFALARERLPAECATQLARIHSITPATHATLFEAGPEQPSSGNPAADALAFARRMLDTLPERRPALELALHWLRANTPTTPATTTLVHGDFRTGNFLVTEAGLSAVLDWEFAHWGAPAEDIAWMCVRDWRFGQLRLAAGGFARRAVLYEAYERASGRPLSVRDVHFWEVMGNVRWAAASLHQGERYMSGGDADIELVAVARRAIEMEYEALRLIERGPS
jgi:aminoglycoside phosphotransferase (APT) family kinase protein